MPVPVPVEAPSMMAEVAKYGGGAVMGVVALKALDIIQFLIKRRRSNDNGGPEIIERRAGNLDVLNAAKEMAEAAKLAKDAAFDAVKAAAETNATCDRIEEMSRRTHERTTRIMDIQHELASAFKDVAHGIEALTNLSQQSLNILQKISENMAVTMDRVKQILDSK